MEEDITCDLNVLQSHLDGMLDRVQHNSLTLKRLQSFERHLLGLTTLPEMIRYILDDARQLFDLDVISLCLADPLGKVQGHLAADDGFSPMPAALQLLSDDQLLRSYFQEPGRPVLGLYQTQDLAQFFVHLQPQPASAILAPMMRRGQYLGSINLGSYSADRFISSMATDFVEHLASVVGICLENTLNFENLRHTSLFDPLTGVNNRRFLEQRIEEELDRSLRTHEPLSCLFLDVDFFKTINDTQGHTAGDYVLVMLAGAIKKQLRNNDVLARFGGEEFVALMSQTDERTAGDIAERIRTHVAGLPLEFNGVPIQVTISVGSATFNVEQHLLNRSVSEIASQLIKTADDALYQAKQNGRNRVENAGVL